MRWLSVSIIFCCALMAGLAQAQGSAPVQEERGTDGALAQAQQRAGFAYRQLQQAQYEKKLAEQDYVNTRDAYRAAKTRADDLKRETDAMRKALDAAKSKEAAARAAYEKELNAVDRLPRTQQR